ncbi:hypothetical protein BDY19DRAFT_977622 [Irpex rosettiformis]|uniref:Uncharacterized protein n=1 Tax=Irpex rosettiformis TaxID=378272 RepID=A0ACB8TNE1_9APHY|nr:hypothetical protein BDY19DRAFT_977622 [Irpex rosettiformis]
MLSVFLGGLCIIAGLLVPDFFTSPVKAHSVMSFDRGGQAAFVVSLPADGCLLPSYYPWLLASYW